MEHAAGGAGGPEGIIGGGNLSPRLEIDAERHIELLAANLVGEGEEGKTDGLECLIRARGRVLVGVEEEGELLVLPGDGGGVAEGVELENLVPVVEVGFTVLAKDAEGGEHLKDAVKVGAETVSPLGVFKSGFERGWVFLL